MNLRQYLKRNDMDTYKELKTIGRRKWKKIKLGDRPETLIQHDSYKRQGERIRQMEWWG